MASDPLHQFKVETLINLPLQFTVFGIPIDMSITNSVAAMMIAAGVSAIFFAMATYRTSIIPGRFQVMAEGLFGLIDDLSESIIGQDGKAFFPFVFTLFLFILSCNLVGMTTFFTATSQLAVTLTLAMLTILIVVGVGIARHGLGFFKLFVPSGVPLPILFFLVPIEVIAFVMRPITLSLRLFGNMVGGHIVLKVFAGFVLSLGALGALGWLGGAVSLSAIIALTALEFMVSYLQAFVFAVLACVYISDVVNIGHH
jgi:F-type H+-transporting ATPase subunit a